MNIETKHDIDSIVQLGKLDDLAYYLYTCSQEDREDTITVIRYALEQVYITNKEQQL